MTTTRTAAAQALGVLAWGLVRYAACIIRYEVTRTAKALQAEHRWRDQCSVRWLAFRLARDAWRAGGG